jgi:hypothetical protein
MDTSPGRVPDKVDTQDACCARRNLASIDWSSWSGRPAVSTDAAWQKRCCTLPTGCRWRRLAMVVIEIKRHRWGWKVFEAPGVEPVFPEKCQAINYAQNRASFRSGEIR